MTSGKGSNQKDDWQKRRARALLNLRVGCRVYKKTFLHLCLGSKNYDWGLTHIHIIQIGLGNLLRYIPGESRRVSQNALQRLQKVLITALVNGQMLIQSRGARLSSHLQTPMAD